MMAYAHLMAGNVCIKPDKGLQHYIAEFMQLKRLCNITDEGLLKAFFVRGLIPNPYLAYSVLSDTNPDWLRYVTLRYNS